ncbi:MAG: PLP-dependent transferase [Campylobacterales bacterium]|nr:PLP-dependent transferase [Campylobacterales bacterium]
MKNQNFKHINLGQSLPMNNIHAVSVSIPKFQDIIDYEENNPVILKKLKNAYPRFKIHSYLVKMSEYLRLKYSIEKKYEIILFSSSKAVKIVSDKYYIHNPIIINEDFGVLLVLKGTSQLAKVLKFIQYVGCNLSSRFAEDYLYTKKIINKKHKEILYEESKANNFLLDSLSIAYNQKKENICLCTSGMNAIYSVLKAIKKIQEKSARTVIIQLGCLYLDTMNIISKHYNNSKIFYDIYDLNSLDEYLKNNALNVCTIITEVPTNPMLKTVDIKQLSFLCKKYNIPLIIDSTLASPYNIDLKPYADIVIESLTKYACGNADVLMGTFIINENSKFAHLKEEFFKYSDKPYIKDIQRLAYEIQTYEKRMFEINNNTKILIKYLEKASFVKKIYHTLNEKNYINLMKNENAVGGVISLEFNKNFQKVYDILNFAKGPSLGTEFTLLMPYTYLAHYDCIITKEGREFLKKNDLPIDLLRVSVGLEDINKIINEFEKLEKL